jgi:hypothetical protein
MSIQKVYYNMKLKEIILILYNMIYKKKEMESHHILINLIKLKNKL